MIDIDASAPSVATDELWRTHAELMRFATVLVGPNDAHDVVVEAVLRSASVIERGGVRQPRTYLFRAVANQASSLRRARQRRWARDLHALVPPSADGPQPDLDVQRAVAGLSVGQRAVVYLAYWEDLSERTIADVLQISYGTVRRHLVRARTHLRRALR
jgi:RNA polymerase sigma factor (sigma-70 family)